MRGVELRESPDLAGLEPAPESAAAHIEAADGHRWWRDAKRRRMLAASDLAAGLLAVAVSPIGIPLSIDLFVGAPVLLLAAKLAGLYDLDHRKIRHLTADELGPLLVWAVGSMLTIGVAAELFSGSAVRIGPIAAAIPIAFLLATTSRALIRRLWRATTPPERTMVIGGGELRETIERKVELFPDMHLALVNDSENGSRAEERRAERQMLGVDAYRDALNSVAERVDRMIVAHDAIDPSVVGELVGICRANQVKLSVVSPLSGRAQPPVMTHVAELPVMEYDTSDVSRSTASIKRGTDILVALALLAVLAIPMALIAVAIKLSDRRGPVLFRQTRAGMHGRPFEMLKFRSMHVGAEQRLAELVEIDDLYEPMFKIDGDPRVTRIGTRLRHWSLDELPQLLNVLKGHMSMVGPRPEELRVVDRYRPEHRFRLDVKPGLTGPMQVYGRDALTFAERLAVELDYIENASFGRDMRIMLLTVSVVGQGTKSA